MFLRSFVVVCFLLSFSIEITEAKKKRGKQLKCFKFVPPAYGLLSGKVKAEVFCEAGYSPSTERGNDVECRGSRTLRIPHCVRDCGALSDPTDGSVSVDKTVEGGVAKYSCNRRFKLVGNKERSCQSNGQWSGSEATCQRRVCVDSVASANGQVCCPSSCGSQCGGPGCDSLTGGASDCCQAEILKSKVSCDTSTAPCVLLPVPDDVDFLLNDIDEVKARLFTLMQGVGKPPQISPQVVPIRDPYRAINYIIALQGVFPSRNRRKRSTGSDPFIGSIQMFGGNFAPRGWAFCNGQLLPISGNNALFSLLGTNFGGDGRSTFGLPDLRGRVPIHPGLGPGLSQVRLGQSGGSETIEVDVTKSVKP